MKYMKSILKRFLLWLGAAVMLLAVVGCAKAPVEDVAAKKNTERIVEIAQNGEALDAVMQKTASAAEQVQAPERLTRELNAADGLLTIHIDAPVIVPDASMPIVRVAPAQFSQEQVTKVFRVFCGDTPMYWMTDVWTKSEIAKSIAQYREQLLEPDLQEVDREHIEQMIAEREAAYESAPETKERVRTDGTLMRMPVQLFSATDMTFLGVEAESLNHNLSFQVHNDYDNTESVTQYEYDDAGNVVGGSTVGVHRSATISCTDYRAVFDGALFGEVHNRVYPGDPIPEEARPYINVTPDEAYDMAEQWLSDIGVSDTFAIADVFLDETSKDFEEASPIPEYYYGIFCTRRVNGIPCAYLYNYDSSRSGEEGLGNPYWEWGYERLNLTITKGGLAFASWAAPLAIQETVAESAVLKPFSEIVEIAYKTLPIMYEKHLLPEWVTATNVEIDRITLSLQRIVEQGQFDCGLLVPVWNFFGTWTDTRIHDAHDARSGTMLSINAIDGSVIDVAQGY